MLVSELIEHLKSFPQDLPVFVTDYEYGGQTPLDNADLIEQKELVKTNSIVRHYGNSDDEPVDLRCGDSFKALVIG